MLFIKARKQEKNNKNQGGEKNEFLFFSETRKMPSEDEYSEAEESASDEEEEVKSGEDAEDYDEHSDEGSRLDEDENKKKTKTMAKAGMKEGEQSVLESISTEVPIRGPDDKVFVFGRSIKKRVKPFPRAFDVEYRLLQPAEHSDSTANGCKVLRTVAQIKEFLQQNELPADAIAEFDFSQRYGENGELTDPLREGNLIGNGPQVLRDIDALANDFAMGNPGTCGKDGQGVPVGDGQPTLRVKSMTIGGTAA